MIIDHTIAMTLIGGIGAACIGGGPKHMISGAIFSALTLGPIIYWLKLQGNAPGQMNRPANIFYTAEASKDEIERFTHEDQVEILAH
jgi:hypothetical protein